MAGIQGGGRARQDAAKVESLIATFHATISMAQDMIASGNDDLALRYYLLAEELLARMPAAERARFEDALRVN
jgi:hypothetical protein